MLNIDGVNYYKVTDMVTLNGTQYARTEHPETPESGITRIVDDEGDTWHLRNGGFVLWDMNDSPIRERSYILQAYGISDEY